MDQLLAKLTSLGYEVFGVFLPGLVAELFLLILWYGLGPMIGYWTGDAIPQLTVENARDMIETIDAGIGIGLGVPVVIASYFLGNTLVWVSRSGRADPNESRLHLLAQALIFRVPKPRDSFRQDLVPIFDQVRKEFARPGIDLTWTMFYPIAKNYLFQNQTNSLVSTYQNKYTLHRSLLIASAALFWLSVLGIASGLVTLGVAGHGHSPRWIFLPIVSCASLFLIHGFSDSYRLNWGMFGNTIITETYALLFGPKLDDRQAQPSSP